MALAAWARDLARSLLSEGLPRRWAHTQGVAAQARSLAPILGNDTDLLEASAWLHDIGYSPNLADPRLCNLVAHHSCAITEAEERGLSDHLAAEFTPEREDLTQALIYCDMTTGPDGQPMTVDARLSEIATRYGETDPVTRFIRRAGPTLTA